MKRSHRLIAVLLLLLALGWFFRRINQSQPVPPGVLPVVFPTPAAPPLVGERHLQDYARPDRTVRDDLQSVHQLLTNFQLLVKHPDALPLGANAEIAAALRGQGRHNREAFLPAAHPAFNANGEFIDRWGTPLIFHAESRDRISIRSAGPDGLPWTEDDTTRGTDGEFRSGG